MSDLPRMALVIGTRPAFRDLVQARLEARGYRILFTAGTAEALEHLAHERPDLIVLDAMLPYDEGFACLRRLKAEPSTAAIPVIMATPEAEQSQFRGWGALPDD
jgi:two-component system, OmpR family, phosphate regulon response regulator PhoB